MNTASIHHNSYTQDFLKSVFDYFLFDCFDRQVTEQTKLTNQECIKTLVVDDEIILSKTITATGVIYKVPNNY
ncbi:hypothetical protein AL469_027830 [Vibrio harveyi]|nr:hypothetical protein AL469_027830 [Vibrio harveyi]